MNAQKLNRQLVAEMQIIVLRKRSPGIQGHNSTWIVPLARHRVTSHSAGKISVLVRELHKNQILS